MIEEIEITNLIVESGTANIVLRRQNHGVTVPVPERTGRAEAVVTH